VGEKSLSCSKQFHDSFLRQGLDSHETIFIEQLLTPSIQWLRFLEHLGLEKLHIDDKDLETTAADYLPDDVLAVPAYADVGFVVVMAAVSGAHSFTDTTSLYPVIVGEDFQFDFRQHQTLGTVGAFMKYEKGVKGRIEPSHDQIMLAIRHARGEVEVGAFGQTSSPDDDKQKLPNCKEALSVNAISQSEPFGILKRLTEHQCKRGYALCKADLYIQEDEHHLLWPLLAKTPKHVPAIFPSEHSRVPNILTILALNSRFWSRPRETLLSNNDPRELLAGASSRINHGGAFVQHVDYKDLEYVTQLLLPKEQWNAQQEVPPNFEGLERSNLDDEDCTIVLTQIFQASLRLLYGFDDFQIWFNSMYPLRRQFFRMLVLLQLQQVDKWLAQKNRENCDVSCRILSLHFTTLALLDAEKAIEDNRFGAISSESIPFSIWRDLHFADSRQKDIIVRHKKTIQTLGAFFELLQGLGDKKTLPSLKVYGSDNLYWGNICYILKNQLGFLNEFHWVLNRDLEVHDEVLRRVGKVLDSCHESILAYGKDKPNEDKIGEHEASEDKPNEDKPDEDKTSEYEPSGKENSNEDKPDIETTEEDKQIGDALIWRCILISLLFWTVPDSSKMISSGVWEHVIPII
jgi:hypothetical protein